MRKAIKRSLGLGMGALLSLLLGLSSSFVVAYFSQDRSQAGLGGGAGLRSYFQKGTGTASDPYVIARPDHMYNLSRLQNLGVFGPDREWHFSLGYDIPDVAGSDLFFYDNNNNIVPYLDMSQTSISAIGSEGMPFYGIFKGNNKEIYGLTVNCGPEDAGVFGYTYSGSSVSDVYFNNLTITDHGYSTEESVFYVGGGLDITDSLMSFKGQDIVVDQAYDFTDSDGTLLDQTFSISFPKKVDGISYSLRSSSEYFSIVNDKSGTGASISINRPTSSTDLDPSCIENNTVFLAQAKGRLNTRFSLIATKYVNAITYSKVLSTYTVSFFNTLPAVNNRSISLEIVHDGGSTSSYAHGTNIGFLIGHCDGTCKNGFVYNGTFKMNNSAAREKMNQESETGLIGEVGPAIENSFSPEQNYENRSGDTGVVDFTRIYKDIAGDTPTYSEQITAPNGTAYRTFEPAVSDGLSGALYKSYLRHTDYQEGSTYFKYVTNDDSSISFKGKQIVADGKDPVSGQLTEDRGLGVFSISTGKTASEGDGYLYGINEFAIKKSTDVFSSFFYTTAEYYNDVASDPKVTNWDYSNSAAMHIEKGYYLPDDSSSLTWSPSLEQKTNYIFKCDLRQAGEVDDGNYFRNTDNPFLENYLSYKLVDKNGNHLSNASKDFGILIKSTDPTTNQAEDIHSFDSYLRMSSSTSLSMIDATTPATSVNFSVKSDLANVTVLAASTKAGNTADSSGNYLSVYDKTSGSATNALVAGSYYNRPLVSTYIPYIDHSLDFPYFTYAKTGTTSPYATFDAKETYAGTKLFAHTFCLKKGDYFIASPSNFVYLYYVCAQGQEGGGNIGSGSTAYSQTNQLLNIDFLSLPPVNHAVSPATQVGSYDVASYRTYIQFQATFSNLAGSLNISASELAGVKEILFDCPLTSGGGPELSNLLTAIILNKQHYGVTFRGIRSTAELIVYPEV